MTSTAALTEREKKKMHEKHEKILADMMNDEPNRFCADCGAKGTRWASWNLGVFLCIRCGGIHRKLGTHISRIKSITLDTWTPEQIASIQEKGNTKMNALYNPNPERHPVPNNDVDMEQYIRDKYERKVFMGGAAAPAGGNSNARALNVNTAPASVPGADRFANELSQLRSMGFANTAHCVQALAESRGDVQRAVEILVARASPVAESANANAGRPRNGGEESALSQLRSMGFTNDGQSLEALRKFNGSLSDAVNYLVERGGSGSPATAANNPFAAPAAPATATATGFSALPPAAKPKATAADDLLSLDFGAPAPAAAPAAGANTAKTDILSLYNNNNAPAANPFAQGGNPFAQGGNPFAQSGNAFAQGGNAFGQPANPFGQQGNSFGQPANPFAQGGNAFGQPANPFAQPANPFAQQQTAPAPAQASAANPFAQQSSPFAAMSGAAASSQRSSVASSAFSSSGNAFSQAPTGFSQPQAPNAFSQPSQNAFAQPQAQNAFGQANQPSQGNFVAQPFGMNPQSNAALPRQAAPAGGNPFGAPAAPAPANDPFAGLGSLGSAARPATGKPANPNNPFF